MLQREGAAGLTVRSITEAAGCSTTGIYTYFGGKNGLIEAIFLDGLESFDEALQPAYDGGDLLAAGHVYRRWALANPTHYLVMFGRAVPDFVPSDETRARAASSFDRLVAAVAETLVDHLADRGHANAEASNALIAAYHLYATVHGYVMLELVGMGPAGTIDLEQLYDLGIRRALDRGAG